MGDENQPRLDSWDDFAGDFIKAEFIRKWPAVFIPVDLKAETEDGRNKLILIVEFSGRKWNFDLNKTNQSFLRTNGITSPKMVLGKKLTIDKIKARNPSTNSMVDSLIIIKVE